MLVSAGGTCGFGGFTNIVLYLERSKGGSFGACLVGEVGFGVGWRVGLYVGWRVGLYVGL